MSTTRETVGDHPINHSREWPGAATVVVFQLDDNYSVCFQNRNYLPPHRDDYICEARFERMLVRSRIPASWWFTDPPAASMNSGQGCVWFFIFVSHSASKFVSKQLFKEGVPICQLRMNFSLYKNMCITYLYCLDAIPTPWIKYLKVRNTYRNDWASWSWPRELRLDVWLYWYIPALYTHKQWRI